VINNNTYVVPAESPGEFIIYSPIKGFLAKANSTTVQNIAQAMTTGDWPLHLRTIQKRFAQSDMFDPSERFDVETHFSPVGVMIELTTDCPLRCRYCYANAGDTPENLPWPIAEAAINLISNNSRRLGKKFSIFFHGRGEPTLNWIVLEQCVNYSRQISENNSRPTIRMATNGVLEMNQLEFITEHFESISLSLDGPQEIHDRNRKFLNGNGSFEHAFRTGQYFLKKRFPFGIKAVVTSDDVDELNARIAFFQEYFPGVSVGFEPVNEFGRCKESGTFKPDINKFISFISKVMDISPEGTFSYSGILRPEHIRLKFCGALRPTFGVHVDGRVVACVGVPLGNEYADAFCYGAFDFKSNNFVFESQKIEKLRHLLVDQFGKCDGCFAKWNCAGDCASYRLFQETSGITDTGIPLRCLLNRELLRKQLLGKLRKEEITNRLATIRS